MRDHHVEAEDRAARLVSGALVEPAFDDHIGAGHGESGTGAQKKPARRIDPHARNKSDDGTRRSEGPEGPYMAHAADEPRRQEAARNEASRPARAQQAERGGGKTFHLAAQGKQQPEKP